MRKTILIVLALAACSGDIGPMGPAGPQGVQGIPGPGTRTVLAGQLNSSGDGFVTLPSAAGSLGDPPAVTCYIAETANSTVWLLIATSNLAGACGLVWDGATWAVGIVQSEPFWFFRIVVVY